MSREGLFRFTKKNFFCLFLFYTDEFCPTSNKFHHDHPMNYLGAWHWFFELFAPIPSPNILTTHKSIRHFPIIVLHALTQNPQAFPHYLTFQYLPDKICFSVFPQQKFVGGIINILPRHGSVEKFFSFFFRKNAKKC